MAWAVDIPLTLAVLWSREERVAYLPGVAVDRSRDTFRGDAMTDARDARIIAEQARTGRDLAELRPSEEVLAELAMLTSRRRDLVQDQTTAITRLRAALVGVKVLKRVFYQSAFASLRTPESRAFYERKRAEGKRHHQAVLALARRWVNVVWAMLRDATMFKPAAA